MLFDFDTDLNMLSQKKTFGKIDIFCQKKRIINLAFLQLIHLDFLRRKVHIFIVCLGPKFAAIHAMERSTNSLY